MKELQIKLLTESAKMPFRAHPTDAGLDFYADSRTIRPDGKVEYGTGVAALIQPGFVGLMFMRSSICNIAEMDLTNAVGVIDPYYTGEITFVYRPFSHDRKDWYQIGDKIGQMVIVPCSYPTIEFVGRFHGIPANARGNNGYGSSGK